MKNSIVSIYVSDIQKYQYYRPFILIFFNMKINFSHYFYAILGIVRSHIPWLIYQLFVEVSEW